MCQVSIYGVKVSFWGSGTLKIVIYVENHPQKRSFWLALSPLWVGVLISGHNMYTYHIYTYRVMIYICPLINTPPPTEGVIISQPIFRFLGVIFDVDHDFEDGG